MGTNHIEASRAFVTALVAFTALLTPSLVRADPIQVTHLEGLAHGFVAVHTLDGTPIASGDLIQHSSGTRVTTRLRLQFKDGSLHEETTVYTQRGTFHLLSNHVVQRGPAFQRQLDSTIHQDGRVKVRYAESDGQEKVIEQHMKLPADLANGLILVALKNLAPGASKKTLSYLAMTPKPRLVQLHVAPDGEAPFSTAGIERKATRYTVKVHVPGLAGVVAAVAGKTPADSHVWMLRGEAPVLVRAEMALASDGPTWRIDVVGPTWSSDPSIAGKE